ncbi:hypothetical protein N7457_004097 [Penicillium paradoxum]|uniref:uncharacterized protein n=1 Tax=Penicillium paradoxum TaxID=176176 RepID=UPI0025492C38|nr:uncharacterized protein N7457_004097 [Penicillium paradoxum]KAJ5782323.1 hypothetical protein N7457_004097 [Penicillium paradoxum]
MLLQYALLFAPLVNAWTFRYTNVTNATEIARGDEPQNCTNSPIGQDRLFTWDPEGSDLCVSIYRDTDCISRGGYACGIWRKNASAPFSAFDVMLESEIVAKSRASESSLTQTSTSSSTPTSTFVTSVSASVTPTPPAAASNADGGSSGGSSLSGGAIAGVVIGVVAGVLIIVGLVVFYMKKKNKPKPPVDSQDGGYGPHEVDATGSSTSGTTAVEKDGSLSAVRAFRPPPGSRVVELAGDEGTAELGSSPISEMDAQSQKKFDRT